MMNSSFLGLVVLEKEADRWCFEVVELTAAQRPGKGENGSGGDDEGQGQDDVDNRHNASLPEKFSLDRMRKLQ